MILVGFSGAVEQGYRSIGMVVSLVLALLVGFVLGSFHIGFGVFIAGTVVAHIVARRAGDDFRAAQWPTPEADEEEE